MQPFFEPLMGPHWEFILASYVITTAVLGGLIAWLVIDAREQNRLLEILDPDGRRSGVDRSGKTERDVT